MIYFCVYNKFCYQISYMVFRTASVLEVVQVFYPISSMFGRILQFLILSLYRKDVYRLLTDLQTFVNLSITYSHSLWLLGNYNVNYCVLTEAASNTIYKITDATVSTYCKIYERMFLVSGIFYTALPIMIELHASRMGTSSNVYKDVGFYKDL